MQVADAFVRFVGDMGAIDNEIGLLPGKAGPVAKKFGEAFKANMSGALVGIGGVLTGMGAGLTALAEPIEKANATLRTELENTGRKWDDYKGRVDEAVKTEAKFGHGSADTREALAKMTAAFQDPDKALKEMSVVTELAAAKHISLSEAAALDVKMHAGAGKAFKEFGINIKDNAVLLNEQTKAEKLHEVAVGKAQVDAKKLADLEARLGVQHTQGTVSTNGLTSAQQGLAKAQESEAMLHERLQSVGKLSLAQQQQEKLAHEAVTAAQQKVTAAETGYTAALTKSHAQKGLSISQEQQLKAAHDLVTQSQSDLAASGARVEAATSKASGATKDYDKIIHEQLLPRIHGVADAQADTWGGKFDAIRTKVQNFAAEDLAKLGPPLTMAGPLLMAVGSGMQIFTTIMGAKTAATAADAVATDALAVSEGFALLPVLAIVAGIALLVGGFILAYQHIKPFRDLVNFLWKELEQLWHWIVGGSPGIVPALQLLGTIIGWLVGTYIKVLQMEFGLVKTIVEDVMKAFGKFVDFLKNVVGAALGEIAGPIGKVGEALGALNPFARHSPSLVDNVIAGTDIIRGRYTSLSDMSIVGPSVGGIQGGSMPSLSAAIAAGGGGDNSGGITTGDIIVNHPQTEFSIARALQVTQHLATMASRGVAPAPRPQPQGA